MPPTAADDHPPPLVPGPPLHPITMELQDQDQPYHPWSQLAPSYHYHSPLLVDDGTGSDMTTATYIEAVEMGPETSPHLLLEAHTTHRFRSTPQHHPHHHPRPSPPMPRPSPIPGSDPTQDPTTATATSTVSEEMFARIHLGGGPGPQAGAAHMSTGASLDPSLDGSPSWSSAMTPLMTSQLDHLYHYQAQRQHSAPLGPPPRQDSYPAHPSSLSTTAPRAPSPGRPQTTRYSMDLHRQQQEQLRLQLAAAQQAAAEQQFQAAERERLRRKSAEELYALHMGFPDGTRRPSPPHAHPYYPAYAGALPDAPPGLDPLALAMDGEAYPAHPQAAYRLPLQGVGLPPESLKYESRLE